MNNVLIAHILGNEATNNRGNGMVMTTVYKNGCKSRVAYHTREGYPSLLIQYSFNESTASRIYEDVARCLLVRPMVFNERLLNHDRFLEYHQVWVDAPTDEPGTLFRALRENHFQPTRVRNTRNGQELLVFGKLNRGYWQVHPMCSTNPNSARGHGRNVETYADLTLLSGVTSPYDEFIRLPRFNGVNLLDL